MDPHASSPDLSLMRLRVFAAVVEQGGYSAAARSLGLSQPTVSFHVQALEQTFGTTLLIYRERRAHFTAAGEALYALARRTLRDVAELSAQIAGLAAGQAGRVRLAASIAFECVGTARVSVVEACRFPILATICVHIRLIHIISFYLTVSYTESPDPAYLGYGVRDDERYRLVARPRSA